MADTSTCLERLNVASTYVYAVQALIYFKQNQNQTKTEIVLRVLKWFAKADFLKKN